jgi:fatty acid amide hydrolase
MGEPFRSTATELAAGRSTSVAITKSILARIAAVEGRVNAFTEVLQAEALAAAQRADEERRQGHVRGPLHGLPVTIKESIGMAGHASTLGVPSRRNERAPEDAVIVHLLREAGAVLLGRTNVSQLLLFHESRNPVF